MWNNLSGTGTFHKNDGTGSSLLPDLVCSQGSDPHLIQKEGQEKGKRPHPKDERGKALCLRIASILSPLIISLLTPHGSFIMVLD